MSGGTGDRAEQDLLEAMRGSPGDGSLRLVYADLLLARGDSRGELILLEHREETTAGGLADPIALGRLLELAVEHGFLRLPDDPDRDVLPFEGGGSHPVQYELDHEGRHYYLRWRSGGFTIDVDDVQILESGLGVDDPDDWSAEETNVILAVVSAAIRAGGDALARIELGDPEAIRSHPLHRAGPRPRYVFPETFLASLAPHARGGTLAARDFERWHRLWNRLRVLERLP